MKTFAMLLLAVLLGSTVKGQDRPLVVDNSAYFPPIRSQQNIPNCSYFSLIYYLKSAIWNKQLGRDPKLEENQFSHSFVWNQNVDEDSKNYSFETAAYFMQHLGAASVADFVLDETSDEVVPSLKNRESAMAFKTKVLHRFSGYYRPGLPEIENRQLFVQDLKDSLVLGQNFVIGLKIFDNFMKLSSGDVYDYLLSYRYESKYINHALVIVGYNDSIKTADGYGAFKALNSSFERSTVYLSYSWFYDYGGINEVYFLEEDFSSEKPSLALHFDLKNSVINDNYYGSKFIFAYSLLQKETRQVDFINRDDYLFQKSLVQITKLNGQDLAPEQRIILPLGSDDGNYRISADLSNLCSQEDFQSMEVLVLNPLAASFIGGNGDLLYSYKRKANFSIENAHLSFIGLDQKIIAKVVNLPDTNVVFRDYYSLQLYHPAKRTDWGEFQNGVYVQESSSRLARKVITFSKSNLRKNTAPILTSAFDSIQAYTDSIFRFQFTAFDAEGDNLRWRLVEGKNATIDSLSGMFEYRANTIYLDGESFYFSIEVQDSIHIISHSFRVDVRLWTSVGGMEENENDFSIYPNPCRDFVNFCLPSTSSRHLRLEIFDVSGRLVALPLNGEQRPFEQDFTYDASPLKRGLYICRLLLDGKPLQSIKLMKD